jgi:hypothetical protein
VSAGVYPYTLSGDSAIKLASIEQLSPTHKRVTITDSASREIIGTTPTNYIGYVLRISNSTVTAFSASEVNNYGVIVDATVSGNSVSFVVANDQMDFSFTAPSPGNAFNIVLAEILPFVKITGNGSGAYAFPIMSSSKTITSVVVAGQGANYSSSSASIDSTKTAGTVHPTLRIVQSPKGGHGSNILKELNIKDVIVVIQITDSDSEAIRGGGSYRQFGIIKNPVLNSDRGRIAGTENTYYRDLFLVPVDNYFQSDFQSDFSSTGEVVIIGDESKSSARVVSSSDTSDITSDGSSIKVKTVNSSGKFVSRADRPNDYILKFATDGFPSSPFRVNEKVYQVIPSGTVFDNGIVYGYDLYVEGKVLQSYSNSCVVQVSGNGNFVVSNNQYLNGAVSGLTATIGEIQPRYGESVRIFVSDGEFSNVISRDDITRLYKIVSVGQPYYDTDNIPSYRGLHLLEISTSVSGATGNIDVTSAPLTQTSFSNGDIVSQGSTAAGFNYAAGTVYEWDFVNPAYGRLYLTGVTGKFLDVEENGLTGTALGSYVVSRFHPPEIDTTSGEILYIDNVRPITRISGQKEEFRLRLGF